MADKKSSPRRKGRSRKGKLGSKPSFPFEARIDPHDPVEQEKAVHRIRSLMYDHPSSAALERFLNKDIGLGDLQLAFISRHLRDCESCRSLAEKKGHPSAEDLEKVPDKETTSRALRELSDPDAFIDLDPTGQE